VINDKKLVCHVESPVHPWLNIIFRPAFVLNNLSSSTTSLHGVVNRRPLHQEKTCEDITPYGGKPQFPKNGRLFTPKYRFITPSTFDHTEKKLFTPSIFKITPS
jgi:hypothetical protein